MSLRRSFNLPAAPILLKGCRRTKVVEETVGISVDKAVFPWGRVRVGGYYPCALGDTTLDLRYVQGWARHPREPWRGMGAVTKMLREVWAR